MQKAKSAMSISITDAIRTDGSGNWYQVQGPRGSVWIAATDLIRGDKQVRDRIHRETGAVLVTAQAKRDFEETVQAYAPIRDGIVALHPGWLSDAYVCGDTSILTAPNASAGVDVVTFAPIMKYEPSGTLSEWQEVMTPFVQDQVLPFFVVSLALSGPLLRFLPAEVMNPQVELVGPAKNGKSTLGTLAASVWAGDPNSTEGGGASWNLTANAYDELRKSHRDMAMILDEAEGSGTSGTGRAALASTLIFAGAVTSSRRRYTDTHVAPALRIPVLSTANTPLWEVLKGSQEDAGQAALSRMFSIRVARHTREGGLRIFTKRPAGFSQIEEAARALRNAVSIAYGSAGPAFAQVLVNQLAADPVRFRQDVFEKFTAVRNRLAELSPRQDARHLDMMAAIELAATLAQEGDVLPLAWGSPQHVVEAVLGSLYTPNSERQLQLRATWVAFGRRLRRLRERGKIVRSGLLPIDNDYDDYDAILNQPSEARRVLFFDPNAFKSEFKNADGLLKTARSLGFLHRHASEPDRYTIKAPRGTARFEGQRVYAFDVTNLPDLTRRN